jgi:apolipoprotein N-acyltransferase
VNRKSILKKLAFLLIFCVLFPLGYGQSKLSKPVQEDEKINVSLVQGNIDPYEKWSAGFLETNASVYRRLTRQACESSPELIVWPETATACYIRYRAPYFHQIRSLVDSIGVPLVTGTQDFEWVDVHKVNRYNSAFLIRPNQQKVDRYHKIHPVPFSERVPLGEEIPGWYHFLDQVLDLNVGNYATGDSIVVFQFLAESLKKWVRFSVVICYESVFPDLVRKFIRRGAQFLVIITNDGWFGKTSGPFQHARIAVFRAIENGIWIVRCANTGISAFIDPCGRTHKESALYREAVLNASISPRTGETFFTRYGMVFPWLIGVVNGVLLILALIDPFAHK